MNSAQGDLEQAMRRCRQAVQEQGALFLKQSNLIAQYDKKLQALAERCRRIRCAGENPPSGPPNSSH